MSYVMTFSPEGIRIPVLSGETILEASRRYGLSFRIGCREGGCGICKVKLLSGKIRYQKTVSESVISQNEQEQGIFLLCRAVPMSDINISLASSIHIVRAPFSEQFSERALKKTHLKSLLPRSITDPQTSTKI